MLRQPCKHEVVSTIYLSPWGDISTTLNDLKANAPKQTRPFLSVTQFTCATCHRHLTRYDLGKRIKPGGDLYDPRFWFPWNSLLRSFLLSLLKRFSNH